MTVSATSQVKTPDVEAAVTERYSSGARRMQAELCCRVDYDSALLEAIPREIIERDYGCGDPSRFVQPGDTVVDLGSGGGKICYIAAQIVGPAGRVIGVDMNSDMLALARKHQPEVADRLRFDNVDFRRGRIQDLALDLERLEGFLSTHPVRTADDLLKLEQHATALRREHPMIADQTADIVLSNCVLNLVRSEDKRHLFAEIFRVLKVGGRAAISDIVSDEAVPESMQQDPELWSGCISGAYQEQAFLQAFLDAGFYGVELIKRDAAPWRTVQGIEFRAVTVVAHKGKEGPCFEHHQALIYRGPFRAVSDDDGHTFVRGQRAAVCEKSFARFQRAPYRDHFFPVEPLKPVSPAQAQPFDCTRTAPRHPRETKGFDHDVSTPPSSCCGPHGCR